MTHHPTTLDQDQSAEARIIGIAHGTVNPLNTLIRSLRDHAKASLTDPAWVDLTDALYWLYNARDSGDAVEAHDNACEALMTLLERDYDGDGVSAAHRFDR